jgi:replicative DNA helicase
VTTVNPIDAVDERVLPASPEAERAIPGAILLDSKAYFEAAEYLKPEDFALDSHRRIYARMVDLADTSRPIDMITLVEELEQKKDIKPVGDVAYISSLLDGVPDRPSIAHYVGIVKQKTQLRTIIFAARSAIARAVDGEKPSAIVGELLKTILDVEAQAHTSNVVAPKDFMTEVLNELEQEANSGGLVGLPTGLDPLDVVTGGLRPGELIVIGALPSAGKTAFATQIVTANAMAGHPVGVFSLEMSRWDLGRRLLSSVTPVNASKIRHPGHFSKEDWRELLRGAAEIAKWPVWFDDSGTMTVTELLARARLFITRMKVKLIVVDYLQLVRAEGRDPRERVGNVADALRQLAKTERVPVVLLSQLRRPQNVNDVPTMIDLKESGDIEAHAHVVLLLHAPIAPGGIPTGEDTIIIGKNRNGAKGPIAVRFCQRKLRFDPRGDGAAMQ